MSHWVRMSVVWVGVCVVCAGLLGCPPDNRVTVPNCAGVTQALAEATIRAANLTVGTVSEVFSDTVASGMVVSQTPASGARVDPGTAVDLALSKGPAVVTVPDVVGMSQAGATMALASAHLSVGTVSEFYSDTVPTGDVIAQNPAAGTSVASGSSINLAISKGVAPVSVPNVAGMTQANAESAITGLGLSVGTVTQANHTGIPAGSVISQDPAALTSVAPGTPVDLVVSLGPVMVPVPDVVRNEQADAEAAILAADLTVGAITTEPSDLIAAGYVISQEPEAAESAPEGSAVNLVVASGLITAETVPLAMLDVPGGTFEMGDDSPGEARHDVTLSPYLIGAFEVTAMEAAAILNWAQDRAYLTDRDGDPYAGGDVYAEGTFLLDLDASTCPLQFEGGTFSPKVTSGFTRALHPMTNVSWHGAILFCNALSERDGYSYAYDSNWNLRDTDTFSTGIQFTDGYRLPTEAEWEYAAAWAGAARYLYGFSSDTLSPSRANYDAENPLGLIAEPYTTLVGHYNGVSLGTADSPSPAGCYDMTGNVKEWCHDWSTSYPDEPVTNPIGPTAEQTYKVIRGGDWTLPPASDNLLTTEREAKYSGTASERLGFRIARTPSIKE